MSNLFYTYEKAQFLLESLYDEVVHESDPVETFAMNEVFKVDDFDRAAFTSYEIAGPGLPQERKMLEDLAPVNYEEGEPVTVRPFSWGGQMAVPQELIRMFAKFGENDSDTSAKIASYADFMKHMKFNGYRRADLECIDKLVNGTSTDPRYVGRDGEPLFSTNHATLGNPGRVQSNLTVNMSLTEANLMAVITALRTQKDHNGAPIKRGSGYTLVTGPALETQAWKILNTEGKMGSAENDKSRVYSMRKNINHVTWDEFDSDFTGWFVFANKHGLRFKWMERPYFQKESHLSTNSLRYSMNESGRAFHTSWYGSYASLPS